MTPIQATAEAFWTVSKVLPTEEKPAVSQKIILDESVEPSAVTHIMLCTGKVYCDLLNEREQTDARTVAVVRVEQLYPLLPETLVEALSVYPDGIPLTWVQEEPLNMGANPFVRLKFEPHLRERWSFDTVGRPEAATPATGSAASHKLEQQILIQTAFKRGAR